MVDSSKDLTSVELMTTKLNHWNADKIGHWTKKSLGFGHLMLYNTPESLTESLPFVTSHNKLCITADARIDNRSTLSKEFNLTINSTINKPDSWFILEAYKKWGSNCASKLEGDFAFAIWDAEKNKIYCARDQIGIKPFYYYFNNGIFAFATEMKGITALKEVDNSLNTQWISDYVLNIRANRKYTFYKHINRLEAAHQICVETDTLKIKKYWELNTIEMVELT